MASFFWVNTAACHRSNNRNGLYRLLLELGIWVNRGWLTHSRDCSAHSDRFRLAGGGRLFGVDDFFQRILQFDSPLASNSRFKPEHRTESYRSGLATRVDASYSSESGNRFAFI